jgi:5-methyltetrahydrofolate--homocysteine methyltransferase
MLTNDRVWVFDGGMGTCIQQVSLTPDDFEGLDGCNEILVATRPQVIADIHAQYYAAGADIVETNTFGATSIVLAEYDIAHRAYELNLQAAQLAKQTARDFSTAEKPRYVAGSIGPTTKLPTLGHIAYSELVASFTEQIQGLVDGGVDILLIETCQDLLQAKAALAAAARVGRGLPVMVQVTIETTGTMLVGTDIASVVSALSPFPISVIGMNCATGPVEMADPIRHLCQHSPFGVSCLPNAGLPENVGGKAHYHLQPQQLAEHLSHFVQDLGVHIVGGCCGTTPEHIKAVSQACSNLTPARRQAKNPPSLTSLYSSVPMQVTPGPLLVGERTNANGSKQFCRLLSEDNYDALVDIARNQVRQGAHVLDVCTAYVSRNEVKDMCEVIDRFNAQVDVPLMIDSTEVPVIEAALQRVAGRAIVNSINLEDGEERLNKVAGLCRQYGAAVVALTIDEEGMAKTAADKLRVAQRIYDLCVQGHAMKPEDLVFDTLTFTLGSGDGEFRRAGIETLDAIRDIKAALPGVLTVLGISNISFGLNPAARYVLNSVFLYEAVEAGLDMAIINPQHLLPLNRIAETERQLCLDLIYDRGRDDYDPLTALMAHFEGAKAKTGTQTSSLPDTLEERLPARIVQGEKGGLEADLIEALKTYPALAIINDFLLEGMKTVGELFGRGEMQLPFVLQAAEVMKQSVAILEPHMEKEESAQKGSLVLATVKGDVHDIGKNLVDIILTNNGYKVYNLGIKQPIETILQAALEHQVDAIGMSGLLVKSTAIMKENLQIMQERGLKVPVFLGGAALTERFVREECETAYAGSVRYCKDAFASLRYMDEVTGQSIPEKEAPSVVKRDDSSPYQAVGAMAPVVSVDTRRSDVAVDVPIPQAPFWGSRVEAGLPLETVWPYLNKQALFAGQWQVRRGVLSAEDYQELLRYKFEPLLAEWCEKAMAEDLLQPAVVYGYFPCNSDGNDLIVYHPGQETQRFTFPRGGQRRLCLSDFFAPVDSGRQDVVALTLVSMGQRATEFAHDLYAKNQYTDYLYFHGLAVEATEALAEYWHQRVRQELGIAGQDAEDIAGLLRQGYQGSRFSFGYPACPNLEDQAKLWPLLDPGRIGVSLSEEFMLVPEQATSALIAHHPEACYFDVRPAQPV